MKWRSAVLFLLILVTVTSVGHARKFEITPLVNYVWTSKIGAYWDNESGDLDIGNSASWGIAVDIDLHQEAQLELLYNRQDSYMEFLTYPGGIQKWKGDLAVEYYQIGGLYRRPVDKVEPFFLFTLGATRFAPKGSEFSDEWKFSIIMGLGAKVWVTDRIGLRFQGRMLMPMLWSSAGFWCGLGGCSLGYGGGSALVQGDLGVGLTFRFGD
jgi:hypothetical protein